MTAGTYTAKYRDGSGIVWEVATGCRDETAARQVLSDLVRRAELVKAKVMTVSESAAADYQSTPLSEHFSQYLMALESEETSDGHRANVRRCLNRIAADSRLRHLSDVTREALETWLAQKARANMGARTRNLYRSSLVAFCN